MWPRCAEHNKAIISTEADVKRVMATLQARYDAGEIPKSPHKYMYYSQCGGYHLSTQKRGGKRKH